MNRIAWVLAAFFCILVLAGQASAADDYIARFSFTNNMNDATGTSHGYQGAGSFVTSYPSYNLTGDGSTHSLQTPASSTNEPETGLISTSTAWSVAYWAYNDDWDDADTEFVIYTTDSSSGNVPSLYHQDGNGKQVFGAQDGSHTESTSYGSLADDSSGWHHFALVWNNTDKSFIAYVDGVEGNSSTFSTISLSAVNDDYCLGHKCSLSAGDRQLNGYLDELRVYNRMLSSTEVQNLYNFGTTISSGFYVTINAPADNDHTKDDPVLLNFTLSDVATTADCQLYIDDTYETNKTGLLTGTHNFSISLSEGSHDWYINCLSGGSWDSEPNRTIVIDLTNPDITINPGNFFNTLNTSIIYRHQTPNVTFDIDLDDTNLWAFQINVSAGGVTLWEYNRTGLAVSTLNIANETSIAAWPDGEVNVSIYVEDDHTAEAIPDYDYDITAQSITYTTPTNTITLEAVEGNLNSIDTEKLLDRYTFGFTWNSARTEHQVDVSCDEALHYRGGLYLWPTFVCGKNWVDFVPNGMTMEDFEDVVVTQKTPYKYNLNFKTAENVQGIDWRSLGGLNNVTERYSFTINNTPGQVQNLTENATYNDAIYVSWDTQAGTNHTLLYLDGIYNTSTSNTYYNFTGLTGGTEYLITAYAANASDVNYASSSENNITATTNYNTTWVIIAQNDTGEQLSNISITISGEDAYYLATTFDKNITLYGVKPQDYEIVAEKTGFGDVFSAETVLDNATTTTTLTFDDTAGSVVFYVHDLYDRIIYQATIRITREADGLFIGQKNTDLAGSAAFDLGATTKYYVNITKDGYVPHYQILEPVLTEYTIYLEEVETEFKSPYTGITANFTPTSTFLLNDTNYDFTFLFDSTYWTVTGCGVYVYNEDNTLLGSTFTTTCTGSVAKTVGTGTHEQIRVRGLLELNNTYNITFNQNYNVNYYVGGNYTLKYFFDDLRAFSGSGFDGFGRVALTILVIITITVLTTVKMEWLGDSERVLIFITALVLFASYLNFLYLDIPMIPFDFIKQYGVFLLLFILTASVSAKNWGVTN